MASISDLWAQAEEAATLNSYDFGGGGSSAERKACDWDEDAEDFWGQSLLLQEAHAAASTMIRLEDGDIHLCDSSCPYAVAEKDGDLVCPLSGRVVSHVAVERTDYSTGRSTWSADPDMQGGGANGNVAWRKKIDKAAASRQAHRLSEQINDSEMPAAKASNLKPIHAKRGALCVDEKLDADSRQKRTRVSKKHIESNEQISNMVAEASAIFSKLMLAKRTTSASEEGKTPPKTSKLTDATMLFEAALKKYAKEVAERKSLPCIDDVHNIRLAVDAIVRRETQKEAETHESAAQLFKSIRFREIASRLAVSLWRAACATPYMKKIKRGGDSFRPFVVGVFYSMKRGLNMSDGTVLVPSLAGFQNAFPTQREITCHAPTKALHASSHRGLCSIHRSLASLSLEEQLSTFNSCIRLVKELQLQVR